ncbi:MAG: DNA polymerase III subunit alpha [Solirubrobacterales bacterium]
MATNVASAAAAYVELHAHSAFSFHDGVSHPHELATAAAELGYSGFALTDHDAVHGSMEFAHAAEPLGVLPIHGSELTLTDGHHVTLIVAERDGWTTLCRLLTLAHAETREGSAQRTAQQPQVSIDQLIEQVAGGSGLICLSGCALRGAVGGRATRGDLRGAEAVARSLRDVFGSDNFRIELQRPFARNDRARNRALTELAERIGVPTVATGNVHSHNRERVALQDVFVAVKHNATLDETEALRRGNSSHVLVSPVEMARRFAEFPRAVQETREIFDRIDFDLTSDLGYRYPGAQDPGQARRLRAVCERRLVERYGRDADHSTGGRQPGSVGRRPVPLKEARARLEDELRVIEKLQLPGFFLIHHDLLELAREIALEVRGRSAARSVLPPGRGRGSSVSSIVCYLTGLSHVDPLEADLCLGRFLHEELTSLPDIDLDFPRDIRHALIPRVHERYGKRHSALVAAFPTYRTRGALRSLAKALGLPTAEIERIIRQTDRSRGEQIEDRVRAVLADSPSGARLLDSPRWQAMLRLLPQIHRLPRGLSQHSGGMVISTDKLDEVCPIVPAAMVNRQIVQWDKDSCGDAGFAKIDLLGLGMLSAVERTVDYIGEARGVHVDLSRIPLDDPETFEQIRNGETTGVFQIESRAQMQMLVRSRPESLNDIFIQVAIVRPGPITGGAVHPYLDRRKKLRADPGYEVPYAHPLLKEVLEDTLGSIVFQDQVIEVARVMADFSPSEGEGLRRAMSRKRSHEALAAYHLRFVEGAAQKGVPHDVAENVFAQIIGFSGFGFPKAHAAAFGLLAYQTSWLRCHYGPELLCGLMNEQPMGFYLPDALAHEAQRRGIPVLPVDVNLSGVECSVEWVVVAGDGSARLPQRELAVRIGLGYVKGAREEGLRSLVAAREEGGPFVTVEDLAGRSGADGSTLEKLAWAGACDHLGLDGSTEHGAYRADGTGGAARPRGRGRREALWLLGAAPAGEPVSRSRRSAGGGSRRSALGAQHGADQSGTNQGNDDFAGAQLALPIPPLPAPQLNKLNDWDEVIADYAATGMTVGTHPLALLREQLQAQGVTPTDRLDLPKESQSVKVAGLVVARQRPGTAKGVVFVLLEDEVGVVNVILPPRVYERYRVTVRSEPLLTVSGKLERKTGAVNVLATGVEALFGDDVKRAIRQIRRPETGEQDLRRKMGIDTDAALAAMNGELPDEYRDAARKVMGEAADIRAVAPVGINFGRRGR